MLEQSSIEAFSARLHAKNDEIQGFVATKKQAVAALKAQQDKLENDLAEIALDIVNAYVAAGMSVADADVAAEKLMEDICRKMVPA